MNQLKLVEFRQAEPADLKADSRTLKVGQTYALSLDNGQTVNGIFSIRGDEDPFILKYYLDEGLLLVPVNQPNFMEWIQREKDSGEQDPAALPQEMIPQVEEAQTV